MKLFSKKIKSFLWKNWDQLEYACNWLRDYWPTNGEVKAGDRTLWREHLIFVQKLHLHPSPFSLLPSPFSLLPSPFSLLPSPCTKTLTFPESW